MLKKFIDLYSTLLSNLSISIKNIQILVKLEQGVQYEILINGINLELNKANTNNILNITTIIDLIELKIKNEIIALMEKAMKLQMIVETKDNNQVKLKINCIVSYLDFVLNKKQIKTIIKSFASYGSKIDQTNKTLIMLQHQAQASVVAQKDKRNFQLFEIKDFEVLNIELLKSKELNSVSNNSSQEILQSLYCQFKYQFIFYIFNKLIILNIVKEIHYLLQQIQMLKVSYSKKIQFLS